MITETITPSAWRFREIRQMNEAKIGFCEGKNPPNCQLLTGAAGCGKTFRIRELIKANPSYARLTASTGIAAVNLGGDTKTINSELKFFNDESIKRAYERGYLQENLAVLANKGYENLAIDEMSMLSALKLDYLIEALADVNEYTQKSMGFIAVGDFLQLPPIADMNAIDKRSGQYVFRARCWPFFKDGITRLIKIWRQDNPEFIEMMNLLRAGKGRDAVALMQKLEIQFRPTLDKGYEGTTLIAVNKGVDDFNRERLQKIQKPLIVSQPTKRGTQLKEWDKNIPLNLYLKEGAYVMILANDVPDFKFVNGDCGILVNYNKQSDEFNIKLVRTGEIVGIKKVKRKNYSDKEPDGTFSSSMFHPYMDFDTGAWIVGTIEYHPLRLAYATTTHKSQGLSLDKVQVETKERFFGAPAMSYVAFSRARTPENLIVVGNPSSLVDKINVSKDVLQWI